MVVIASRIIGSPSDNGDVVMGNFERWPFDDLDMLGPRRRRRILSGDGAAKEQAARYSDGCPYHEAPIHRTDPLLASFGQSSSKVWGSRADPILVSALRN